MSGINKVILLGRLGKDPELKDAKGVAIANFSIATSKTWKDDAGEKHEKTQWTDVVAFRKTAEIVGKYLKKGRQVYIEGALETRSWEDKETGAKKYRTEVIAERIEFIGDRPADDKPAAGADDNQFGAEPEAPATEEIPF